MAPALLLFLLPAAAIALGAPPRSAGNADERVGADGPTQRGGVDPRSRRAPSGAALIPTSVTWDALPSSGEKWGRASCRSEHPHRISFPSTLGGIAVGILVALPFAAAAIDHLYPSNPATLTQAARQRASTWCASGRNAEGDAELESLDRFWPRCTSLTATLLVQSISSIILGHFNKLIASHPSIILFLTTIVGLGGNAGCQSTVLTVRRLALGQSVYVTEQAKVGVLLSLIVGPLLLARTLLQGAAFKTSMTIVFSSIAITIVATTLGCALPKLLWRVRIDPAHSASFIQVAMDILGILIVCLFGMFVLD